MKENAILFGPFVGEMYWEAGRFAPMLPYYKIKKYKKQNPKFIVLTREERFDLYGKYADIFVPLRIDGDYDKLQPNCFRLNNYSISEYNQLTMKFSEKYKQKYKVLEHVVPDVNKKRFLNKNQFPTKFMLFKYKPRSENYEIVNEYLPNDGKPLVVLAPRFRKGFKRNWRKWPEFYNTLVADKKLMNNFNFIICGKKGEYIPDSKHRFYDMNDITPGKKSSLIGLLLVILEKSVFTFGSQSAIPNISLLYNVEVLEFGCQKNLHTKTYNHKNTPITFIENKKYNIEVPVIFKLFKKLVLKKKGV
jgi:hypothetical protein